SGLDNTSVTQAVNYPVAPTSFNSSGLTDEIFYFYVPSTTGNVLISIRVPGGTTGSAVKLNVDPQSTPVEVSQGIIDLAVTMSQVSDGALVFIERSAWWLHIIGILAFLNYLPWSKHLHILLAFPNAYYARLTLQGQFKNMPSIQQEVKLAFQPELASEVILAM
ncbi:MAG: hypothetical protein RL675_1211, partial [Bacteroidota bacterium]